MLRVNLFVFLQNSNCSYSNYLFDNLQNVVSVLSYFMTWCKLRLIISFTGRLRLCFSHVSFSVRKFPHKVMAVFCWNIQTDWVWPEEQSIRFNQILLVGLMIVVQGSQWRSRCRNFYFSLQWHKQCSPDVWKWTLCSCFPDDGIDYYHFFSYTHRRRGSNMNTGVVFLAISPAFGNCF